MAKFKVLDQKAVYSRRELMDTNRSPKQISKAKAANKRAKQARKRQRGKK